MCHPLAISPPNSDSLAAAYEDQSADMAALAPQVAAWVWSLPEDQLGAGVGQAMEAQCKAR